MTSDTPALPRGWRATTDSYADNTIGYRFTYCLVTPRKNFIKNMTEAEKRLLLEHVQYLKDAGMHIEASVDDPEELYGFFSTIFDATAYEVRNIAANDPAIKANLGFHVRYFQAGRQGIKRRPIVRDDTGKQVSPVE